MSPLVVFDQLTPRQYMLFVITLTKKDGNRLSKSSYGLKRSSLSHLFRCHNNIGFSEAYKNELGLLFNGFYRQLAAGDGDDRRL